jgi:type I restriction enzyme S subunit
MNETLEAMARAIFKDWFVDFGPTRAKAEGRPPYLVPDLWDLFPNTFEDDGCPRGWLNGCVGEHFHLTMGQSPPGNTYNESSEGLPFFQGRTDFGFRYPTHRKFCSAPTRTAETDDTLVSVRAPVGDINMAWEKCCVGRGVSALRHLSGSRSFTYYSAWAIERALKLYENTGTVFGAINKKQFEALATMEPTTKIIAAFESMAGPLDERIRANVAESRRLTEMRELLLPRLMSGEVRIADDEEQLEAPT